jgi:hypothetical protein
VIHRIMPGATGHAAAAVVMLLTPGRSLSRGIRLVLGMIVLLSQIRPGEQQ